MIKSNGNTYTLFSRDGTKRLGTYPSLQAAKEREKQIIAAEAVRGYKK
jgi:hypothetical protein